MIKKGSWSYLFSGGGLAHWWKHRPSSNVRGTGLIYRLVLLRGLVAFHPYIVFYEISGFSIWPKILHWICLDLIPNLCNKQGTCVRLDKVKIKSSYYVTELWWYFQEWVMLWVWVHLRQQYLRQNPQSDPNQLMRSTQKKTERMNLKVWKMDEH